MASDVKKMRYWSEHMKGWQASGLSQRAYCQREGVALSSFDHWRRQLKQITALAKPARPGRTYQPLTLVPVQVINAPAPGGLSLSSPGGWRLTLTAPVGADWLAEVLKRLP